MNIILLSGGSGKRLWPLSNDVRSKQFLKILRAPDGSHESMLQRMYRGIRAVDNDAFIAIATSKEQLTSIQMQILKADAAFNNSANVSVSIEPCRRNTFPAIALAAAHLVECCAIDKRDAVVVCPIDPYVDDTYFEKLKDLYFRAKTGNDNLVLMGIQPTYPSEKYGYIIPHQDSSQFTDVIDIKTVIAFKEKPDAITAQKYISEGALWNSGVFAFRIDYLLSKSRDILGTDRYQELLDKYYSFDSNSFDYAIAEKESQISVIRYLGTWKDIGTWNTLTEAMSDEIAGNAIAPLSVNTHIINELQIPLIALGIKDIAVVATPDGILITDKKHSDKLKDYVVDNRPMYEKRIWGEYKVLEYNIQSDGSNSLTKHLIIKSGQHISYQLHNHRSEIWTFIDGTGILIIDGISKKVKRGDTVCIIAGIKHAIKADKELHIIEVQIGDKLTEEDIERFDWVWDK